MVVGLVGVALGAIYALGQDGSWGEYAAAGHEAYERGDYAEAERQWTVALELAQDFEPQDGRRDGSRNDLAMLYRAQARYAEAEALYKRSLTIWEKALGPEDPTVAQRLNKLAELYGDQGKYAEAEQLVTRALRIDEAQGPEHPHVATGLNNLAELYRAQGRYVDAEPLYKRAVAILETAIGPEYAGVAQSLNNRAAL